MCSGRALVTTVCVRANDPDDGSPPCIALRIAYIRTWKLAYAPNRRTTRIGSAANYFTRCDIKLSALTQTQCTHAAYTQRGQHIFSVTFDGTQQANGHAVSTIANLTLRDDERTRVIFISAVYLFI